MEQMTKSAEARVSAVKLERLGYTDGCVLEGGWRAGCPRFIPNRADRTVWVVIYDSGNFSRRLGMHLVNDLVDI